MSDHSADGTERTGPFIDMSGDDPTGLKSHESPGRCHGSSVDGGECSAMGLSFESIQEWRNHCEKYHPVTCVVDECSVLSGYKRDNAPSSCCYKHIPDEPTTVYAWGRTNTKSVVDPPRADPDHPIEAALPDHSPLPDSDDPAEASR